MTTLDEGLIYNGRSPDRRRPAGPGDSLIRLYDLMASKPDGITLEDAAEHLVLGFPTDQYRAYAKYLETCRRTNERFRTHLRVVDPRDTQKVGRRGGAVAAEYGSLEFRRRAHRWHANEVLRRMVKHGTAYRESDRWCAGRSPWVVVDGHRRPYVPGSNAAKTAERIQALNTIAVLRRIQRRLRKADEVAAIDDAVRNYRRTHTDKEVP